MTQFQYRIGPFRRYFSRVVFHRSVSTRLIQSFSGHTMLIVIKDIRFVRMEHTFDYVFCLQRTLKVKRFPLKPCTTAIAADINIRFVFM